MSSPDDVNETKFITRSVPGGQTVSLLEHNFERFLFPLIYYIYFIIQVDHSPLNDLHEQFMNTLDNLDNNQPNTQLASDALQLGSKTFSDILASLQVSLPFKKIAVCNLIHFYSFDRP